MTEQEMNEQLQSMASAYEQLKARHEKLSGNYVSLVEKYCDLADKHSAFLIAYAADCNDVNEQRYSFDKVSDE